MKWVLIVLVAVVQVGCGGSKKAARKPGGAGMQTFELEKDEGKQAAASACADSVGSAGTLDQALVECHVLSHRGEVMGCYQQALEMDGTLSGVMSVAFTITASGTVIAPEAQGTGDETLTTCIEAVFSRTKFPNSEGTTRVRHVYALEPGR